MITKFITTRIESIARAASRRPRYAPALPQQFRPRLITTRGGHIAAVSFRHRSPPDLYFATHRCKNKPGNLDCLQHCLRIAYGQNCQKRIYLDISIQYGGGDRTRTYEAMRRLIYSQL